MSGSFIEEFQYLSLFLKVKWLFIILFDVIKATGGSSEPYQQLVLVLKTQYQILCPTKDGVHSHKYCNMLSHNSSSGCAMVLEATKVGVAEAKEIGESIKGTGPSGESLQPLDWGH